MELQFLVRRISLFWTLFRAPFECKNTIFLVQYFDFLALNLHFLSVEFQFWERRILEGLNTIAHKIRTLGQVGGLKIKVLKQRNIINHVTDGLLYILLRSYVAASCTTLTYQCTCNNAMFLMCHVFPDARC